VLTDDDRVSGICLSCRAVPVTNVMIELQEEFGTRAFVQDDFRAVRTVGELITLIEQYSTTALRCQ